MAEKTEDAGVKYKFGCLMLQLKPAQIPHFAEILAAIKPEDLYESDIVGEFGIEYEPHVTVLYGYHDDGTSSYPNSILKAKFLPETAITVKLTGVSNFHNPKYDVVKFDVASPELMKLNKDYAKRWAHTNEYDYHPHVTIAYVKAGQGPKYCKLLWELFGGKAVKLSGTKLMYSRPTGDKIITSL